MDTGIIDRCGANEEQIVHDSVVGLMDLTQWILEISDNELVDGLESLELRTDGKDRELMQRLMRRLKGDYEESDFAPNEQYADESELHAHRDGQQTAYMSRMGVTVEAPGNPKMMHSSFADDTTLLDRGAACSCAPSTTTSTVITTSAGTGQIPITFSTPSLGGTATQSNAAPIFTTTTSNELGERVPIALPGGQVEYVSRQVAQRLYNADRLAENLRRAQLTTMAPTNFAHSTGLPNRNRAMAADQSYFNEAPEGCPLQANQRNVNFEDTRALWHFDQNEPVSTDNRLPPHNSTTYVLGRGMRGHDGQSQMSGAREILSAAPSAALTARSLSTTVDVGRTVQGWNLKFSGQKGHSVEEFLQRINERNNLACLPEQDLLNAMTEMLTGVALQWFRRSKNDFATWEQFCDAARSQFGVHRRYQSRIIREAENRTQGSSEPAYEFIYKLLTILSRLEEPWPEDRQVQLIYDNLRPDVRRNVPLHRVTDIKSLIRLAEEAEYQLDEQGSFREPPPPEKCLFIDTAYSAPKPMGGGKVIVSAIRAAKKEEKTGRPGQDDALINELEAEIQKLRAECASPTTEPVVVREPPEEVVAGGRKEKSRLPDWGDGDRRNRGRSPKSRKPCVQKTENAGETPGPMGMYFCYGCGWPGWIKSACPVCSVKDQGTQ